MIFPVTTTPVSETIRGFDWSTTPLGPIGDWSSTLKTLVNLILESEFPKTLVWGPGLVTIHNDAFLPILGSKPSAIGRSFAEVWSEAWDTISPIADKAFAGQSTYIEDFPLVINRGAGREQAYFTFCYSPVRDENGKIVAMMDTVIETTATIVGRATEAVLRRELVHRVKNMLSVTGAVVNATLRHSTSVEEAKKAVGERISALTSAQDISVEQIESTNIESLIRQVLAPHVTEGSRISLSGPSIDVQSRQVLALSLILYELATNAVKHGALKNPDGSIAIDWKTDEGGSFDFTWAEQSSSLVSQPTRRGFGSNLTTRIGPAYFAGKADAFFEPSGLRYRLTGKLDQPTRAPH